MKIALIGCGGVGGVIAANLLRAGHDLTPVVGNRELGAVLARQGLTVTESDGRSWTTPSRRAPVLKLEEAAALFDLALVTTQATTLEVALEAALPFLAPAAPIVVCQNGLPEERASAVLQSRGYDPSRVVGCVVGWGASMVRPGVFARTSGGGFQLGRFGADGPPLDPIAALLGHVAPATVVSNLAGVRWSKLAINCVTTTFGALAGAALGPLLARGFARRLALEVFAEVAAVARAAGIHVEPVGGTLPIGSVAITDRERTATLGTPSLWYKHALLLAVGFKYRKMRSSMLYALERGRPLEIDYLNGEIVRRGALHGVPVPVNRALVKGISEIADRRAVPDLERLRAVHRALGS
jgi:2-dehydropantoate 2-reductase